MKFSSILWMIAAPIISYASPFPNPAVVSCDILSEVQGVRQADANYQLQISDVDSCDSKIGDFSISNTPIKLGFAFVAACQQPDNSFPEHLSGVNLTGPKGSSIYANAFSLNGYPPQQSLQLTTSWNGTKYNFVVHCKIVR